MTAAVQVVGGYLDRIWQLAHTLRSAGVHPEKAAGRSDEPCEDAERDPRQETERHMARVGTAIAELLEPESEQLRIAPQQAARLLLGLIFANRMHMHGETAAQDVPSAGELVEVFLHGAIDSTSH
jgi:hypothetical protein